MDLGLSGKVAFITGGSHGIGLATAKALYAEGCTVITCSRHNFEHYSILQHHVCDVESSFQVGSVIKYLTEVYDTIDILINNVGGGGRWGRENPISAHLENPYLGHEVMRRNYGATEQFTYGILPKMQRANWGRVVTVASMYGKEAGGRPWFTAAKAAQIAFMKTLARNPRFAARGITFNTVAPGPVFIAGTGWGEDAKRAESPMLRLGRPEEVASAIVFLCSDKAAWINGACLAIDGGESASF